LIAPKAKSSGRYFFQYTRFRKAGRGYGRGSIEYRRPFVSVHDGSDARLGPLPLLPNWLTLVNRPQTEGELAALRRSVVRSCLYGDENRPLFFRSGPDKNIPTPPTSASGTLIHSRVPSRSGKE
jgi:hypothetical protein